MSVPNYEGWIRKISGKKRGKITQVREKWEANLVIVGADRIAANGDVASSYEETVYKLKAE